MDVISLGSLCGLNEIQIVLHQIGHMNTDGYKVFHDPNIRRPYHQKILCDPYEISWILQE
jgi:hypothetical protein